MNFDIKEVKIEIYIPEEYIEEIRNALTLAGACRAGNYDHVLSYRARKDFGDHWRTVTRFTEKKERSAAVLKPG